MPFYATLAKSVVRFWIYWKPLIHSWNVHALANTMTVLVIFTHSFRINCFIMILNDELLKRFGVEEKLREFIYIIENIVRIFVKTRF